MVRPIAIIIYSILSVFTAGGQIPADELEKLSKGEILVEAIEDENGLPGAIAKFQMAGSRSEIWKMLNDFSNFPLMYDDITRLEVKSEDNEGAELEIWMKVGIIKVHYSLYRHYEIKNYKLTWERLSGDMKVVDGGWEIVDAVDSTNKILVFKSFVDPGRLIPKKLVRRQTIKRAYKLGEDLPEWFGKNRELYY
jgi:hypothetical protein